MLKDRVFQTDVGLEIAKKELGPKSVWLPVVDEALKTCGNYGKNQMRKFQFGSSLIKNSFCHKYLAKQAKNVETKGGCGHVGAFVVACVNTQLFKNCPQSIWNDSKSAIYRFFYAVVHFGLCSFFFFMSN